VIKKKINQMLYLLEGQYVISCDLEGIVLDVIVAAIATDPDERTRTAK
jgi:hypothetical protein